MATGWREAWEEQGVKTGRRVAARTRRVPGEEREESVEGFFWSGALDFLCCWVFLILFSVEVSQVDLTGFPDRAHSGSAFPTVQAVMLEKSRGGRST